MGDDRGPASPGRVAVRDATITWRLPGRPQVTDLSASFDVGGRQVEILLLGGREGVGGGGVRDGKGGGHVYRDPKRTVTKR